MIRLCNSIYVPHMSNCLLCPNQAREFGTIINDVPQTLDHTGLSTFSLITTENISFPFMKFGPTAYLHVRRPTEEGLQALPICDITEEESWNPYGDSIQVNALNIESNVLGETFYDYYEPCAEHLHEHFQRSISLAMSKPKSKLMFASSCFYCLSCCLFTASP